MGNPISASGGAPIILRQNDFNALLPEIDVLAALRDAFRSLHAGTSVQPPQANGFIPDQVDMIWYPAIFGDQEIFGAKLSPWLPRRKDGPQVTAWTILCSIPRRSPPSGRRPPPPSPSKGSRRNPRSVWRSLAPGPWVSHIFVTPGRFIHGVKFASTRAPSTPTTPSSRGFRRIFANTSPLPLRPSTR
jgi:hypothetical protein